MNRRHVRGQDVEGRAVTWSSSSLRKRTMLMRSFSHGVFVMMATISLNTRPAWKRVQATA